MRPSGRLRAGSVLLVAGMLLAPSAWPASVAPPARAEQLVTALVVQETAHLPGRLSLQVDLSALEGRASCPQLAAFKPAGFRLRNRLSVGLRCSGPERWTLYVPVQVSLVGAYPVAAQVIQVGEALESSRIEMRDGDLLNLPRGAVLEPQQLAGRSARQRIGAGQVLRASALRDAESALRGTPVKLTLRGDGFSVSRDGTAMEDGAPGSTIQVRTPSGQLVSGVVRSAGVVEVLLR